MRRESSDSGVQGKNGSGKSDMAVDGSEERCCVDFKAGLVIVD